MSGRVLMAMSGGVDSSVAAALLQEAGYEVIGATMQIWPSADEEELPAGMTSCCSIAAVADAQRVAAKLGIKHYVLNLREEFERRVMLPFVRSYAAGRTPNPCILCNKDVKFDALLQRALELECGWLATGHYARIKYEDGRWQLHRGLDLTKDQSYALYSLTQKQLAHALFPLGEWNKRDIRKKALALGLAVAEKPDSQQICFLGDEGPAELFRQLAPESLRPGPIVDLEGQQIGTHRGIGCYTPGQRKGLGIAGAEPKYVVSIDASTNTITVGPEKSLDRKRVYVGQVNTIGYTELKEAVTLMGKLRYTMVPQACLVEVAGDGLVAATFEAAQRAPAPGQAAVFYDGERIAFGGVIEFAE